MKKGTSFCVFVTGCFDNPCVRGASGPEGPKKYRTQTFQKGVRHENISDEEIQRRLRRRTATRKHSDGWIYRMQIRMKKCSAHIPDIQENAETHRNINIRKKTGEKSGRKNEDGEHRQRSGKMKTGERSENNPDGKNGSRRGRIFSVIRG